MRNFFLIIDSILKAKPNKIKRKTCKFKNGYGASIVKGPGTYGYEEGLWEVAVLKNGELCYDTPVTDDVVGHLTIQGVRNVLEQIRSL